MRSVKTRIRTVVRKFPYSERLVGLSELATILTCFDTGGPKMSGNFVRERQRIVYIYNIHKVGNLISSDEHMTFVKHKIHRSWN